MIMLSGLELYLGMEPTTMFDAEVHLYLCP